ncbi:MAG: hypothetical protein V1799_05815 [bacterium]
MPVGSKRFQLPKLLMRLTAPPRNAVEKWFYHGGKVDAKSRKSETHPWYRVLWLTGVDYFSTLGYQPGIALLAAGALSPLATALLVIVTLFGALPAYLQVAQRSYAGQGSIAMLENLLHGWKGKIFVLILLGFASTDFVITITLSSADAVQHLLENPLIGPFFGDARLTLTNIMLAILAGVFLMGFTEAIRIAVFVTIPYLALNAIVILRCIVEIIQRPELFTNWSAMLSLHGDPIMIVLVCALIFPKLALGLSGFETGVAVMPLVSSGGGVSRGQIPFVRIAATKKLLTTAALIMSVFLISSSFVTTLLISEKEFALGGIASGRALAFLSHTYLGHTFGTLYDISTIAILWFAGASAMAGLLNVIPRYLPRFGMAPRWVAYTRPLVIVIFIVSLIVTKIFNASVEAQGGAYATGVLVLMLSAAVAVALELKREAMDKAEYLLGRIKKVLLSGYFWVITLIFTFTLIDNIFVRPDGVIIASLFIISIIALGALSRYIRQTELRVESMSLVDEESLALWQKIKGKKVNLAPLKDENQDSIVKKQSEISRHYKVQGPIAFVHVHLLDNRSEFLTPLQLKIRRRGKHYMINIFGAVAVANSLAYLSEQMDPKTIFIGLTGQNLMTQSLNYFIWGEGEVGLSVYTILVRYWEWIGEENERPLIFLMSE